MNGTKTVGQKLILAGIILGLLLFIFCCYQTYTYSNNIYLNLQSARMCDSLKYFYGDEDPGADLRAEAKDFESKKSIYITGIVISVLLIGICIFLKSSVDRSANAMPKQFDNKTESVFSHDRLLQLKLMLDDGLITEDEYNTKKQEILSST